MMIRSVVIILLGVGEGLCFKDDFQNLTDCSLYHLRPLQKISLKAVNNVLSNPVNRQTDTHKQTKNIITLAGKIIPHVFLNICKQRYKKCSYCFMIHSLWHIDKELLNIFCDTKETKLHGKLFLISYENSV